MSSMSPLQQQADKRDIATVESKMDQLGAAIGSLGGVMSAATTQAAMSLLD